MADTIKDEFLLEEASRGDHDAFLQLYHQHGRPVFRFLFRLLGSAEVAEDITHECFLNLIRRSVKLKSGAPTSLRNFLYSAARDLAMEYLRNSPAERVGKDDVHDEMISGSNKQSNGRPSSETEAAEVVASLPPLEREVLIFSEYEGLGLDEIAAIVGSDSDTVAVRLESARERLRRFLRKRSMQ